MTDRRRPATRALPELVLLRSYRDEDELLEGYLRSLAQRSPELEILEAGCGQHWPLDLGEIRHTLTGVDLDQDALTYRKTVSKDLDEGIVGDLRYLDLGAGRFDVIYNSFVLEHIENAELVLENFSRWLKPGGLILLKLPDRDTVFGFLTNLTPFWFHVLYHRFVLGRKNAGKPGFGPYPTYYDRVVGRIGIREFCEKNRLTIREERGLGTYVVETGMRARMIRLVTIVVSALSLGRLPWKHNNLIYVLEKVRV